MKKILFLLTLCGIVRVHADNLNVSPVTIPQGGTSSINIELNNTENVFTAFQFNLVLPEGISYVSYVPSTRLSDHSVSATTNDGITTVVCLSFTTAEITGESGTVLTLNVTADESLAVGTELKATLNTIYFTTPTEEQVQFDNMDVELTVTTPAETRTILDETSTTLPTAATGVDVRVNRTIKANEWSTIVLPFAMNTAQVTAAFGEDVQLADFTSWTSEEDDETDDIVSIEVNFTAISAIAANHPCLIKVSKAIEDFTVDGVDIDPEDEPFIRVGRNKATRGYFTGTYVAGTAVPEYNLFLSGNKFWYSTGATTMKAFRGYFELADVLTSVEDGEGAKVRFSIDGETTGISEMANGKYQMEATDGWYTLDGRKLNGKPVEKGMYIVNGKKMMIK